MLPHGKLMNKVNKDSLNVALIGYGYAGKVFHAPLIDSVERLNLTTFVSSDSTKVRQDFPEAAVYGQPQAVFEDPNIDLIVIATPNEHHFSLAKAALDAGKHVVVDKPFTVTVEEAEQLIAHPRAEAGILSVFHNRRWDADFLTIQDLLNRNTLDRVVTFESHFDRFRPEVRERWRERAGAGGGLWYDLGPHLVDQALKLFGQPDEIFADLSIQRTGAVATDYFHVLLRYGNARIILHASALVGADLPRFVIHGLRGSYVKHGMDVQEDSLKAGNRPGSSNWGIDSCDGELTLWQGDCSTKSKLTTKQGCYSKYYEQVRDAIFGLAPNPVPATEALHVMKLIELGILSNEQRQAIPVRLKSVIQTSSSSARS